MKKIFLPEYLEHLRSEEMERIGVKDYTVVLYKQCKSNPAHLETIKGVTTDCIDGFLEIYDSFEDEYPFARRDSYYTYHHEKTVDGELVLVGEVVAVWIDESRDVDCDICAKDIYSEVPEDVEEYPNGDIPF